MYRSVMFSFAAIGLLMNNAPSFAKHQENGVDPNDRTQDYLDSRSGPSLLYDANSYVWGEGINELFEGPETTKPRASHEPMQNRNYSVSAYAPMLSVIAMVPVTTITTTTVTEEVFYETVRKPYRKKAARKWRPRPRCVCS